MKLFKDVSHATGDVIANGAKGAVSITKGIRITSDLYSITMYQTLIEQEDEILETRNKGKTKKITREELRKEFNEY